MSVLWLKVILMKLRLGYLINFTLIQACLVPALLFFRKFVSTMQNLVAYYYVLSKINPETVSSQAE